MSRHPWILIQVSYLPVDQETISDTINSIKSNTVGVDELGINFKSFVHC